MDLEDQIKLHKALSKKIEEMEEEKKALGLAIMQQMQNKPLRIPGFIVRYCNRFSIKLSLEEARSLNAKRLLIRVRSSSFYPLMMSAKFNISKSLSNL